MSWAPHRLHKHSSLWLRCTDGRWRSKQTITRLTLIHVFDTSALHQQRVRPLLFLLLRRAPYWMNLALTFVLLLFLLRHLIRANFSFFVLFRKYNAITALEQRQQYKEDFCAEYDEYRVLHDRIGAITEMFVQLGSKINTLSPGTQEYKVLLQSFSLLCFHPETAQIRNMALKPFHIVLIYSSSWRTKFYKSIENIKR